MFKGKINKKTALISMLLLFATLLSVFAITNTIKINKMAADSNISPYKYGLVVAKYGYWKTGDSYFADVDYERKNIGAVPSEHVEFDLTFPTTLVEGNYEIDSIIDFESYTGSWDDLNYNRMDKDRFMQSRVVNPSIWNPQAYIGEKNTEVTFTASFKLLNPPEQGLPGSRFAFDLGNEIYECYLGVVIKYVDSDFVKNPDKWWEDHGGNPDDPDPQPEPGEGDIIVYVWYKEKGTEKDLASLQRVNTALGKNLVLSSIEIPGYKSTSCILKGKGIKEYQKNNIDEVMGKYDYTTPDNGYLDVTFYYEEYEEPSLPTCNPQFDIEVENKRITMKRSTFDRAYDDEDYIYFSNIRIAVGDFEGGWRRISGTEWEEVEGEHKFESFDIYMRYPGSAIYDFMRHDIYSKTAYQSLNVPANLFMPTNQEKTEYVAEIEVTLGVFCSCNGFDAESTTLRLYVDIEENQPPEAYYRYATKKTLPNGTESREYNKAYIGKDVVIDNYCDDPNGLTDINISGYSIKNEETQKNVEFRMTPWGEYKTINEDDFNDTSIIIKEINNGSLVLVFTTDEEWEITVYVEDTEGLTDSYAEVIKPEELSLKPTAVIKDTSTYRYPFGEEFNGKQNRVIKLDSNSSYVASWLNDMDVEIDYQKDMWQIEPLDGQDINPVKFERDLNKIVIGNVVDVRYEPLDIKMMFKEPGRYMIRLQVTDTEGNISDWTEQIITIHEDIAPNVTAGISDRYFRDNTGYATINITNIVSNSSDGDTVNLEKIEYQYDSNNNGNFDDEALKSLGITTYLRTKDLGKYRFKVTVKENFGQETLGEHITDSDYKRGYFYLYTEVDNIAPTVITFKIMISEPGQ